MEPSGPVCKIRPRCPPEEVDPLLTHLRQNQPLTVRRLQFPRGTLLDDGRLDLCKQALGPDGVRRVADALAHNTQVAHLLLGADQLGPEGAMAVADLAQDHPTLETLYLGCNGIGPFGARALAEALAGNARIRALWLKRNALGVEGARQLASMLMRNDRIRTLDLVSNDLGVEGTRVLAESLSDHPSLENLYLCGNELGVEGAAIVADLMIRNRSLRRIYLAADELGDTGASLLAAALRRRPDLIALGLSSNDIRPNGAALLADAITAHPSLEVLELGFAPATEVVGARPNRIGDGARAFLPAIRNASALLELDLSGNQVGEAVADELIGALEGNRRITKLALSDLPRGLRGRLNGLLARNQNAASRAPQPHLSSIRSVYRTARPTSEVDVEVEGAAPPFETKRTRTFSDEERGFTGDELSACAKVLEALAIRRDVLEQLPEVRSLMARLLRTGRPPAKPREKRTEAPRRDRQVLDTTGIRRKTGTAIELSTEPRRLEHPRTCYVCKESFTALHHFYDSLCPSCSEFNWDKRLSSADLRGQVALITGSRIKVGREIVLKLLRAGATVIATTRFPTDAQRRFATAPDYEDFAGRLRICGLDLLQIPVVESFASQLADHEPRLDMLINNAAQTLHRPPGFYAALRALEGPDLPATWSSLALLEPDDDRLFPAETDDGNGQPLDLRSRNSWKLRIDEVGTRELLTVNLVNAIAPYLLIARLRRLMAKTPGDKFIINVSAVEGQFVRRNKTYFHPHTNMAKAALNMLTRTSAEDLANDRIYLSSVDPGWFSNENPHPIAEGMKANGFTLPIDEIDGAARVLDPIFTRANGGEAQYGCFLKDYLPTPW